ncbi:MAG: histidine phosphatase family protein [Holophagaceae bacterium]|nr:histidine phosphatase family protein [Holophagaceae bacterium]
MARASRRIRWMGLRALVSCFMAGLLLAAWVPAAAQAGVAPPTPGDPTTVIILRHAERLSDDKDTPLSGAGEARARALVPLLSGLQPDVVVVSELRRTRQTVAPFLERAKRSPLVRSNEKCIELAQEILKEWRGRTVLVAWHRGPHVDLARALGVKEPFPSWTHDTYDRYWVVTIAADGVATLVEKTQPPVKEPPSSPTSR